MFLAIIMTFVEPCLPYLTLPKEVTRQGNFFCIMTREPGFKRLASTSYVLEAPEVPTSNSFSDDYIICSEITDFEKFGQLVMFIQILTNQIDF